MRKIYTSIDIGTESIKVLVCEMYKEKPSVLSIISQKSKGVKKGLIVDAEETAKAIQEAIKKTEETLGIKIYKVIATIPSNNASFALVEGYSTITNDEHKVTGEDMVRTMQAAVYNKQKEETELVSILPIEFALDNKTNIKDPKGLKGSKLAVKAVMVTVPKKNALSVVKTLEEIGLSVTDLTLSAIADYEALGDEETSNNLGALVNIGSETTTVSIFNKGVLISTKVLGLGGRNVDSDIGYVYRVSKDVAKKIKETFAVAHKRYANTDEIYELINDESKPLRINQYEITEVVYCRLIDIMKTVKNDIKNLTNKDISYIIITGGTSEMTGFKAAAEEVFPCNIIIRDPKIIGLRNSKYSTNIGMINYFYQKLLLKGKEYSMVAQEEADEIISTKKQILNFNNDSVIGKFFGYFFDN